ncbi:MAG: sigma-70 family RNA polymerase sigma factor [Planctomycetes bacterium]|nr:sigma-70 family RNA polymerase sigma factor [Planctomycetota bacterium]
MTSAKDSGRANRLSDERLEAAIRRYAPMVLGVCQRVLGDRQEAEDAAQAVFLILAVHWAKHMDSDFLGAWLNRVAVRTALNARKARMRRLKRERKSAKGKAAMSSEGEERSSLSAVLAEELDRLPSQLRIPVLLHHMEGRTLAETARLVGCGESAVSMRITRGIERLRHRLSRRNAAVLALFAAGDLNDLFASVPGTQWMQSTSGIASEVAVGGLRARSASPTVLEMARESSMLGIGIPLKVLAVAAAIVLAVGAVWCVRASETQATPEPLGTPPEALASQKGKATLKPLGPLGESFRVEGLSATAFVTSIAFSPDGRLILAAGNDSVRILDARTGEERQRLMNDQGRKLDGHYVQFSPDGKSFLVAGHMWGGRFNHFSLWDTESSQQLWCAEVSPQLTGAAITPDGKRILTCHNLLVTPEGSSVSGGCVRAWDARNGRCTATYPVGQEHPGGFPAPTGPGIHCMALLPDGSALACGMSTGDVILASAGTGQEFRRLEGPNLLPLTVAVSPDGKTVAAGFGPVGAGAVSFADCEIRVWDVATGRVRHSVKGVNEVVNGLCFSADGRHLISGSGLWERFRSNEKVAVSYGPWGSRRQMAIRPAEPAVRLWDLESGSEQWHLSGANGIGAGLALSRDGKSLVSAAGSSILVWVFNDGLLARPGAAP